MRPGLLTALLICGACLVPEHSQAQTRSPGPRLAPPVICTMANRLDIFVDEDDILWACECEALSSGFVCRWQVIGGVDATRIRRKIDARLLPRRFYWHARFHYLSVLR